MILNGWELGGGSIRIDRETQAKVFRLLGLSDEKKEPLRILLVSFRHAAARQPRLASIASVRCWREASILEVIPFPRAARRG